MLSLLLLACVDPVDTDPNPATEIGNPEMSVQMRATTTNDFLDFAGTSAPVQLTSVWVHVDAFVAHACDGTTHTTPGGWFDLLDLEAASFPIRVPGTDWCELELPISPAVAPPLLSFSGQAAGWVEGVDLVHRPFTLRLPDAQPASLTVESQPPETTYFLVVDVVPWLEGLDLTGPRDIELAGAWDGTASVFRDEDGDEVLDASTDPRILQRTAVVPDRDGDGIRDSVEEAEGSDPDVYDSDDDLLSDAMELVLFATSPIDPDSDGDGIEDGDEVAAGTNPLVPDNDRDGFDADTDCNDDDATVNPAAQDPPGDGIDQDCDGIDG